MEVTVELVDVTADEARKLLLTIDPLAGYAETDPEMAAELARMVATDDEYLQNLWDSLTDSPNAEELLAKAEPPAPAVKEQFLILVTCTDEATQCELLQRFQQEGLTCKALLS
jgi:hypothetical protein